MLVRSLVIGGARHSGNLESRSVIAAILPLFGAGLFQLAVNPHFDLLGFGRGDAVGGDFAVLPGDIDKTAAACAQAFDAARRPHFGERWQQVNLVEVALEQHLAHPGGVAEVAVDLERRVGTEQILINPAFTSIYIVEIHEV